MGKLNIYVAVRQKLMNTIKGGEGILTASLYLVAIMLAARVFSMVREMMLASHIGMNAYTDAFNVSQSAITFFTGVIGATCLALVPILMRASYEGESRRDEIFTSIFLVYMVFSAIAAVLITVLALPICTLLGPGMSRESQLVAADLLRIGFIKINCVVGGSLFSYYLQSRGVFVASGLGALASSVLVVVLLVATPDASIYDYTRYTVYGFALQAVVPLPFLLKLKYRPRIKTIFEKDAIRSLVIASIPLMASTMFFEIQTLVGRAVVTGFGEGTASSLDYAYKLMQLLTASIITSLNAVLLTKLSAADAEKSREKTVGYLLAGAKSQLLLLLPVVILLAFFGEPLISLLFQRGEFSADDTSRVYAVLMGYLIGVWPCVLSDLFTKYYVAIRKTRIINLVNGVGYGISLAIVYPIALILGTPGVSVAFSLAQIVILIGFSLAFFHGEKSSNIRHSISELISVRDIVAPFALLAVLLIYRYIFGVPGAVPAFLMSIGLFASYCILLFVLRVKLGFREIQ